MVYTALFSRVGSRYPISGFRNPAIRFPVPVSMLWKYPISDSGTEDHYPTTSKQSFIAKKSNGMIRTLLSPHPQQYRIQIITTLLQFSKPRAMFANYGKYSWKGSHPLIKMDR